MATLSELCEAGVLVRIESLGENECAHRLLYGTVDFIKWLENDLPQIAHNAVDGNLNPSEQVIAVFAEFESGEKFVNDRRFKKLNRTPTLNVWELKTAAIRIFGWVPIHDAFICCYGDEKDQILITNSYQAYQAKCEKVRRELDLDEPKCLVGESINDVLSI